MIDFHAELLAESEAEGDIKGAAESKVSSPLLQSAGSQKVLGHYGQAVLVDESGPQAESDAESDSEGDV